MKNIYTLIVSVVISSSAIGQWQEDSVSINSNYSEQVWYSLEQGNQATSALNSWDLAFEASGFASSIRVNHAAGGNLWIYTGDASSWDVIDTTGLSTWTPVFNSDEDWDLGAVNQDKNFNDPIDLGWGTYSFITHHVTGNRVFIIQTTTGQFKKFMVESLISGRYTFKLADIDGSNESIYTLDKPDYLGKNFAYFNVASGEVLDREPLSNDWQLLFTQYAAIFPGIGGYNSTGVLLNKGVSAVKTTPVADDYMSFGGHPFDSAINVIGHEWKSINMQTFTWEIADSTIYFVQNQAGDVWRLKFTDFGGSTNGNFYFSKELVFENDGITGVDVTERQERFRVYPNPTRGNFINVMAYTNFDAPVNVSLYDLSGRQVMQWSKQMNTLEIMQLDVPGLPTGLYLLNLESGNYKESVKVSISEY